MCLILFAHDVHPEYSLVLAANRDEFFSRPTAPAARWADAPHVIAGRDLQGGGTWLGVTEDGRWSAVTNFREETPSRRDAPSRGHLVSRFLLTDIPASAYADSIAPNATAYNGFNLLLGDGREVVWLSNRTSGGVGFSQRILTPGIYGLSNHLLDTPWRKVTRGKEHLGEIVAQPTIPAPEPLLDLLLDTTYAAEHQLPSTGVPAELERLLSAAFISTPEYGTRSSTALLVARTGAIRFAERSFDSRGSVTNEERLQIGTSNRKVRAAGGGV